MKKLILLALLALPLSAAAEHLDVIQTELKEGCSLEQYRAIAKDFNDQWGKSHGYSAQIAVPVQSNDLKSVYWLGRSASAESFGKAWDTWRDELSDPKSVAAKLQARFEKCSDDQGRRGYDLY